MHGGAGTCVIKPYKPTIIQTTIYFVSGDYANITYWLLLQCSAFTDIFIPNKYLTTWPV